MFAAEPDQYMAAAILATDAASSMEFSEEMLLKSLSWPITNETKRQEFRLAADVRATALQTAALLGIAAF